MNTEDRDKLVQEIWANSAKEIEKSVTYAIHSELRSDIQSRARKVVGSELEKILQPMIDARKDELTRAATLIVEKTFRQIEEKVLAKLEQELQYSDNLFSTFAQRIADGMKSAAMGSVADAIRDVRSAGRKA
jgi:hypothetical protein